jgi:hypothetical protein
MDAAPRNAYASQHPQVTHALRELSAARPEYEKAKSFFEGTVPEVLAGEKLRRLFAGQGRHFRINYARTPVDLLTERTTVQGWTCKDARQLKALNDAWEDNQLGIEAKDVHGKAYEFGDSYLIGWPDEDLPSRVSGYLHDPTSVRVFYDPERPRVKSHAIHFWIEPGDEANGLPEGKWHRVTLYYPDRVEQWVSKQAAEDATGNVNLIGDDGEYEQYVSPEGEAWPTENPTPGVIPVFHFRTGRPYGRPEHADAYGPQEAINKLLLSLMGAVDHVVLPKRYITTDSALDGPPGAAADPFAAAVGETVIDPEGDPALTQIGLDPQSSMSDDPGDVWLMSGQNVRPGQFEPFDPAKLIGPIESLVQQMADVTDMPANRYHRGGTTPSGDSQRMDEAPLNNKASDRHAQFGVTWHEWAAYVCLVNGLGDTDAQIAWGPPIQYNDEQSWQTALLQLKAGVPLEQVLKERGYGDELITAWIAAGAAQQPDQPASPPTAL